MRKKLKVAINGFGRIGRCVFKAYLSRFHELDIQITKINCGRGSIDDRLYSLVYDSVHGTLMGDMRVLSHDTFLFNGEKFAMLFENNIQNIDWDVDIILECTGQLNSKKLSFSHIESGAKKVIVSAPCQDADSTIILGVNENVLKSADQVISIGSCTTNCIAPLAKIINNYLGIESGYMTTIHSYTNDQSLVDSYHKDKRRSRAAALSIIPATTGAAKSIGIVIPELEGRIDGAAFRVPVPNVSVVDFKFNSKNSTSVKEINELFEMQSKRSSGILSICRDELVSSDFIGSSHSAIFDPSQTSVLKDQKTCRVVAWYDNEFGFSHRMLELASMLNSDGLK
ncbi:Glyceraldehyde-3-phosphate dehydrogenase 2 [Candidatus Cyrtobacter comes]|uniref:Glyceraldehyde-3-phosphate dehydrogenase 2 n=1 Tax=Candidatus Cyrtobacter comes TaxID=675776 RepID=A0ABU5L9G0_9RICK|nr:type I glyceraldehyde-3-phosphate dehydrogenase [Candidatus Cyrtobacter comes]MDZ5762545.1 Glyceraldehyde-3-phosphate dehydrogenase 2 [Candidatus Cyrtobacter comes]